MDGLIRPLLALMLGVVYGALSGYWVLLSLGIFALFHRQSFMGSLFIALSFYGVSMCPVALVSFDYSGSLLVAVFAYLLVVSCSSVLMAFCFYDGSKKVYSFVKLILFFFAFMVPPFSNWSFSSPLWLAGLVFPAYGFMGLGLFIALVYGLRYRPVWGFAVLAGFLMLPLSIASGGVDAVGVNSYKSMQPGDSVVDTYESHIGDIKIASQQKEKTVYFPEDNFGPWNKEIAGLLKDKSITILGGAKLYSRSESLGGLNKYTHVVADLRRNKVVYHQRALPPGIFDPYLASSVANKHKNNGVVDVGRSRVGMFICWESIHIPTLVATFGDQPDYVVLFSNTYSSNEYSAGRFLIHHLKRWSSLFGVPMISSVNGYV